VLLQHAGELSEFVGLLSELAMPVEERAGSLPNPAELEGARLVVVSGNRLLESGGPNLNLWPRTIAVIDDSSKTLVSQLSRVGAAMVIRRPIHPRALRLLLLHEIYRGPERRRRRRILIGNPIRLSSGLFRPHATLMDLSPTGARIELATAPKIGTKIRILLGKDLTMGKPIKLQAKVVRLIQSAEDSKRGEAEIGVAILDAKRHARIIKAILNRFALGPASWDAKTSAGEASVSPTASSASTSTSTSASASASAEPTSDPVKRSLPPTRTRSAQPPLSETPHVDESPVSEPEEEPITEDFPTTTPEPSEEIMLDAEIPMSSDPSVVGEPEPEDRRQEMRTPYDQRIVALGEEAARVLVGRDLSRGGMRIAATSSISVGDVLRVALHSGTQTEPIVVIARALRDDGDDGLVLCFDDLSPSQTERLDEIIDSSMPVHASAEEFENPDSTSQSIVVAEMIETLSSCDPGESLEGAFRADVESEAEIDAHLDSVFDTGESI
jgi:hypothetical protein